MAVSYTLENAEETHNEFPDTFQIPPQQARNSVRSGAIVKLIFRIEVDGEVHVERMWVQVTELRSNAYIGILDNDPYCTGGIRSGMRVEFAPEHIIQIWAEPSE